MANLTRSFASGKMNKSVDERLIPNGEYIDALNVRMGSTEESEQGVIENAKGNIELTQLQFEGTPLSQEARCIGAFEDGINETIYWFVHDENFAPSPTGKIDLVVSYNVNTSVLVYHLISMQDGISTNSTLNFSDKYLITGIDKVESLLYWTDDYNPPRQVNINNNYPNPILGVDQFSYESILVIKKPPIAAPSVTPMPTSSQENFLEDRFICFAYRYKYEDGEYSATSQWSKPAFIPSNYFYNSATGLNDGMNGLANMASVTYNSGGPLVKSIDLLFKEMDSPIIRVIDKVSKKNDGLSDNTNYSFQFENSKIFTILDESEILRLYDNVPLLSKSQTVMGNRLMYGNYVDGYDLIDQYENPLRLEYASELLSNEIGESNIDYSLSTGYYPFGIPGLIPESIVNFDFSGTNLVSGGIITFEIRYTYSQYSGDTPFPIDQQQATTVNFSYILQQNFNNIYDLSVDPDFVEKIGTELPNPPGTIQTVENSCIGTTFTDAFNCSVEQTLGGSPTLYKYQSGISAANQPMQILSSPGSNIISLQIPAMRYVDVSTLLPPFNKNVYAYYKMEFAEAIYSEIGNPTSLHSNRGYEIGMVYMDEFNRSSTPLVSSYNAVYVPCSSSEFQNKIQVTIPAIQEAPYWAKRYKFVVKPDKEIYETIYSDFFVRDPTSGADFFLLEGQNSQKVEVGDDLIVKVDTTGALNSCTYTSVLDKRTYEANFLSPAPTDSAGQVISIPTGVYIKLQSNNFSTAYDNLGGIPNVITYGLIKNDTGISDNSCAPVGYPTYIADPSNPGTFIPIPIPAGSSIYLNFKSNREGKNSVSGRHYEYENTLKASQDYNSFKEWWDGDNIGLTLNGSNSSASSTGGQNAPVAYYYSPLNAFIPCNLDVHFSFSETGTNEIKLFMNGILGYENGKKITHNSIQIVIVRAGSGVVFETKPLDAAPNIWYESSEVFDINSNGEHMGNDQDQDIATNKPAIITTDFFNCYSFGNGVESYKIQDSIIGKALSLGNRVYATTELDYKRTRRYYDITYSGLYNEESNINRLNEFNLGLLNYKSLEQSFGPINKMFARETDILTLQEDKISYVLQGRTILQSPGAQSSLMAVPEILGQQVARIEKFGISHNPESFVQWGADKYFTDAKRGSVIQLKGSSYANDQLTQISNQGMRTWFRDLFNESFNTQKLGGFDPYMNEYVLSSNDIPIPVDGIATDCGITTSVIIPDETTVYTQSVDLGDLVGNVYIDYNITSLTGTTTITATYNGVIYTTGPVTTSGTLTILKSQVNISLAELVISTTGSVSISYTINCPDADEITIVLVTLTSNSEQGLQTTNQYRWTSGTFISPVHSDTIIFPAGGSPVVAQYDVVIGPQGGGVIPVNGAIVTMLNNTFGSDNFNFDESKDKLKYLRTNTLYGNNTADINSLILSSTNLTPIIPPSSGNTAYYSDFIMPSVGSYLYLIWDYRTITEINLCFADGSAADVCCICDDGPVPSPKTYKIIDCITGLEYNALGTFFFSIGDVVKYKVGAGGGSGVDEYGTIVSILFSFTVVDATIQSNGTFDCAG